MASQVCRLALLLCSAVAVAAKPHGHNHAGALAQGHAHAHDHLHHRRAAAANATATAVRTNGTTFGPAAVQAESNATTTLFAADDDGALAGLSAGCVTALTATLDCNDTLSDDDFLYTWGGLDQDDLAGLCTTSCNTSLVAYRTAVATACADDVYIDPVTNDTTLAYGTGQSADIYNIAGVAVRPVALVDYYALNFALLCMVDPATGDWCYSETGNGTGTADDCSTCALEAVRLELEDPRLYDADLASSYTASLSSCKVTAPPLTTPTAVFLPNNNTVVSGYNATSTTCPGSVVPLPTGTACDDFATAHNISTDLLLTANNLVGGCVGFPGNLSALCVPLSCTPYLVQANDTCRDVAAAHNLTLTQLISYNPSLDRLCANWDRQSGHAICVSSPLGYVAPNATISGAAGAPTPATTAAPVPTDAMNGTTTNCGSWYLVQKGDQCALIATKNGIALADFYFLNPEIDANCTNLWAGQSYCVEAVGDITTYPGYLSGSTPTATLSLVTATAWTDYPTATMPVYNFTTSTGYPMATGSLTECSEVFQNEYGNISCFAVAGLYDVAVATWVRWNPSVVASSNSSNSSISTASFDPAAPCYLQNETAYCGLYYDASLLPVTVPASQGYIPPPSDATANATSLCMRWFKAFPNDTCDSICQETDIPFRLFYEWNPALGAKCENLWAYAEYCVKGPGWEDASYNDTTSANSTASSTTTGGPPAATQSGIVASCDDWYVAQSGDTCQTIADKYNIPLATFYAWNPAVGSDCANLWLGEAYCVGIPATSTTSAAATKTSTSTSKSSGPPAPTQTGIVADCDAWYVVVSGDTCQGIADKYSITLATFYAWNPAVGTDCANLWLGEAYCVGIPATSSKTTTTAATTARVTPPAATQSGIPANCNRYGVASSGQGCSDFATANSITLDQLYKWNPVLDNACDNFWVGEAYCIGVSS